MAFGRFGCGCTSAAAQLPAETVWPLKSRKKSNTPPSKPAYLETLRGEQSYLAYASKKGASEGVAPIIATLGDPSLMSAKEWMGEQ